MSAISFIIEACSEKRVQERGKAFHKSERNRSDSLRIAGFSSPSLSKTGFLGASRSVTFFCLPYLSLTKRNTELFFTYLSQMR
uniref:Uncharacterized protein n=2 Tax=Oryza sativa TaxID=4530 RepID=A0A1B4Z169_ORYSI|nr:ORF82 [Oryza sativa Indica Group]BAV53178.1 hypothetical protein [Oryza sativa Indica Group]